MFGFKKERNRQIAFAISSQFLNDLTNKIIPDLCSILKIPLSEGKNQPEGFWTDKYIISFYTTFIAFFCG